MPCQKELREFSQRFPGTFPRFFPVPPLAARVVLSGVLPSTAVVLHTVLFYPPVLSRTDRVMSQLRSDRCCSAVKHGATPDTTYSQIHLDPKHTRSINTSILSVPCPGPVASSAPDLNSPPTSPAYPAIYRTSTACPLTAHNRASSIIESNIVLL